MSTSAIIGWWYLGIGRTENEYAKTVVLKGGVELLVRNAVA